MAQTATAKKRRLKILIVDDNDASAKTLSWMMEFFGHDVRIADRGATAIAAAHAFHPEVLLLDIGMPDINGYELCALLRSEPTLRDALYIAQTGWDQKEHRERSAQAGFKHHLVKPVNMEELQKILEQFAATGE